MLQGLNWQRIQKPLLGNRKDQEIQYMHSRALAGGSVCANWIIEAGLGINVEHVLSKCFFLRSRAMLVSPESLQMMVF